MIDGSRFRRVAVERLVAAPAVDCPPYLTNVTFKNAPKARKTQAKKDCLSDSLGGCWNALKWRVSAAWRPVRPFGGLPRAPATCSRRA